MSITEIPSIKIQIPNKFQYARFQKPPKYDLTADSRNNENAQLIWIDRPSDITLMSVSVIGY